MVFRRIKVKVHILSKVEAVEAGMSRPIRLEKYGVHFKANTNGEGYVRVKTKKPCCNAYKKWEGLVCTRAAGHTGFHRADDCWDKYIKGWDEGCEPWK